MFTADRLVALVALLALLFLMGRRLPARRWPMILAVTLAVIVLVVLAEQNGLWPRGWTPR
jgi:drug/metabolite transporter (DMT)-like permease